MGEGVAKKSTNVLRIKTTSKIKHVNARRTGNYTTNFFRVAAFSITIYFKGTYEKKKEKMSAY